jgi:hypothetical protein
MEPSMKKTMRFYTEIGLAAATASLGVLTLWWQDWIEALTHLDPDAHDGTAEWLIVVGLFALSAACTLLARRDYLRTRVPAA